MARSDLLISLVKASANGDKQMLHRTVEAMIAEERAKRHNVLAERLESALRLNGNGSVLRAAPQNTEASPRARHFISEAIPKRTLSDLILPEMTEKATRQLVEEQQRQACSAPIRWSQDIVSCLWVRREMARHLLRKPSQRRSHFHFSRFAMNP